MSVEKVYSEGCSFMRHYSTCSLNVRLAALVQGLILLSGCAYILAVRNDPCFLTMVSVFGIVVTALTCSLHVGYLHAADTFAKHLLPLEKELLPDKDGVVGPYEDDHQKTYKSFWKRLVTLHATFTLIGSAFLAFLALGVLGLALGPTHP